MANSINSGSISSRRRYPIDLSSRNDAPASKKHRQGDEFHASPTMHTMVLRKLPRIQEFHQPMMPSTISTILPPEMNKIYNLRPRSNSSIGSTHVVKQVPEIVSDMSPQNIPAESEYTVDLESDRESVKVLSSDSEMDEELVCFHLDETNREEIMPASSEDFVFPSVDEEIAFIPFSPSDDYLDWEKISMYNSVVSSSLLQFAEEDVFNPETLSYC